MSDYAKLARERRALLKSKGICIECGELPSLTNQVRCENCAAKCREANKRYQKNNPDKVRARRKDWYSNGKFGYKTRAAQKNQRLQLRKKVIDKYGGQCACCTESTYEFLQIDHLDKDGKQHRLEVGRGMKLHRDMLKDDIKYRIRILCGNCHNAITAHGKCPHELTKISTNSALPLVEGCNQ